MNVLHILDHSVPLFSGYSFRSRNIVHFQQALGIHPSVLTSPKHGSIRDECEEQEGIRYYRAGPAPNGVVSRQPFIREIRLMTRLARRIAEVVREEKIDLIHSHSPLLNGLPALWVARRFGLPLVYEARAFWEDAAVDHGTFREGSLRYRISRGLEMFLFKRAQAVVTICDNMRQELISRGIAPEKIQVVPNGVDVEWFEPQPKPAQLMRHLGLNGHPVFGFIGSFYHYEGLRVLLEAFPEIARRVPGVRLLLVGGGMEEAILREMARKCPSGIIFAGQVPHDNVRDYYALIDVFVFPRRRMRPTELVTPLKPLEAMAMAKAVIASDV
jgi:PEP-CTERM/exosortase A-associated glycosyltransferase